MKLYDFIADPALGNLSAKTFWPWWVVAKLLDGDGNHLRGEHRDFAETITHRTTFPTKPWPELFLLVSRRSGKTHFVGNVNAYTAAQDYSDRLAPGEVAVAAAVAPTTDQARILFDYTRAIVANSPMLSGQLIRETSNELEFQHRTAFRVYAGSMRTTRGPTYARISIDEASFLRNEESANPDIELVRAVRPGLATLGGSLICFSSPYMRRGVMWDAHRKHFGNNDSPVLVVAGESRLFNPTLDAAVVEAALGDDPESAAAEWLGQFRLDLSAAFTPESIDAAIDSGVFERPVLAQLPEGRAPRYVAFCDPAGGSGTDSYTAAIAHGVGNVAVLDALLEVRPPFSTEEATQRVAEFVKRYRCSAVHGDHYAGEWPTEALAKRGVAFVRSERTKSELYLEAVPLFQSGRVRLLAVPRLATQLRMLERRTRPGGKESIDHAPGGHDDLANAAAGALWRASRDVTGVGAAAFAARSEVYGELVSNLGGPMGTSNL